jgi:2-oxoacid:acceptor oxidoreductase gamma subunit (pyruvate/2-ketoisovalerate family)
MMKEIRFHGRGGQGVVKSAQTIVQTVVNTGSYAQFIPFFGVERKGSPVYGFLRIDEKDIRLKTQVYDPEVLMVLDDSLLDMKQTFMGLKDESTVIINTTKPLSELNIPPQAKYVYTVDATKIAKDQTGRNIPNTAMLGAFVKATELVDWEMMKKDITENFGEANCHAAEMAYEQVTCIH